MHDPAVTDISFCTMLITATALLDGIETAMMETVIGTREKYADGQELQGLLVTSEGLLNDYKASNPPSPIHLPFPSFFLPPRIPPLFACLVRAMRWRTVVGVT